VIGAILGFVYYQLRKDFSGVQNRFGAIFFMTSMLGLASLSALDLCACGVLEWCLLWAATRLVLCSRSHLPRFHSSL
jgi:hypothetical protein